MSEAEPLLDVRELSIAFAQSGGRHTVVDRVSFEVKKGRALALVGESGSGKTVTAQAIVRLLPQPAASYPTGEIFFRGRDVLKMSNDELRAMRGSAVTMVFQEPMTSLNPLHTIERQIGEIIALHHGRAAVTPAKIVELLTEVGIVDPAQRLGAYPHQLSGGQRQRVMIAMALANRPDLLIADEPTTALDVTVQAQILKLLKDLQERLGMAMLFITHDLNIVRRIADDVIVMRQGKIVEAGQTASVFANPRHPYTRALLAAEPKGDPPRADFAAPTIASADNLRVWFPIRKGFLRRTVAYVKAVDGVSVAIREGQTVGVVGESGSGKTTLGLAISEAHPVSRADRLLRARHRRTDLEGHAAAPARDADRLPGPLRFAQPTHVGGRDRRGGADRAGNEAERRRAAPRGGAGARRYGARPLDARPLSA